MPTTTSLGRTRFFERSDFAPDFWEKIDALDRWKLLAERFDAFASPVARPPSSSIPRIIHQIWVGGSLPLAYKSWTESWRRLNEGWEYRLWDERRIRALSLENERAFRTSPSFGVKSDIARYEILKRFGGVYADTDFECLKPIDEIVDRCTFFAGIIFGSSPVINNGLMGAIPGHPLLQEAVRGTAEAVKTRDGMEVLNRTGPGYFSELFFRRQELLVHSDVIFPSSYFYPVPNFMKKDAIDVDQKERFTRPWTVAIHYWETAWLRPPWWKKALSRVKKLLLSIVKAR